MRHAFLHTLQTPAVARAQAVAYGRARPAPAHAGAPRLLGVDERAFIAARDSFYLASTGETGWPYVQHRGGPKGFLRVMDDTHLGFADYRGNRQLISTGNVTASDRVALLLMDYPARERLKIIGHARMVPAAKQPIFSRNFPRPLTPSSNGSSRSRWSASTGTARNTSHLVTPPMKSRRRRNRCASGLPNSRRSSPGRRAARTGDPPGVGSGKRRRRIAARFMVTGWAWADVCTGEALTTMPHPSSSALSSPDFNRREFLRTGAVFVGGMLLAPVGARAAEAPPVAGNAQRALWFRQPLRILQTVLRETDARGYDAAAVVAYLQKTACNTLVVNGGGIVDFFQNPLPLANLNPFMGGRDILREIASACRAAGIRVIARVDFRGVEEPIYRQHPDWFGIAPGGPPLTLDYTRPKLYAGCYTSYHRNEHAEKFIRHLLTNYPIDGIWHNSIAVYGVCHCARCREGFKQAAGANLPDPATATPAELDRYMRWKAGVADRHVAHMRATVKSYGEDKAYAAEVFGSMFEAGGAVWSGIDLYSARDHFDFLIATAFISENRETIHYDELHHSATLVRLMKSMTPDKEAVLLYGDNGTSHRYIMDAPLDTRIWLWEALAVGGRFWNCGFTGMHPDATHDRRTAFNSVPVYEFVRDHEAVLAHHAPVANVGIFYSRATRQFYRTPSPEGDRFGAALQGVESALLAGHIPYDFIPDDQLAAERLARYRVVILPNVRCLSEAEIELFRGYVRGGGGLLATFATSLHDSTGAARPDFGLADVFGCSFTGQSADTRKDTYQFIARPEHPLVASESGKTELLLNHGRTLLCRPRSDAVVICTHVPTVNNQPPEKAWVESWSREHPTAIENRFGTGRCIYFANQPDQNNHDMGHPDMRLMLERAVRHLAGDTLPIVAATVPTSVHLGLTRSLAAPDEFILSFVNTTSGPGRPVRELLPVFDLTVTLRLGSALAAHRVLQAPGACEVTADADLVRVRLTRLDDFSAVHLRMQPA